MALHQYNYLALLPSHALPADWKSMKNQHMKAVGAGAGGQGKLQAGSSAGEGGGEKWGYSVFYSLSSVSRVLVISDPFFPLLSNNIGKSVFAMWRIKQAFAEGHARLAAKFAVSGAAPTLLARIIQKMHAHGKKSGGGSGGSAQGSSSTASSGAQSTSSSNRGEGGQHATVKGLTHILLPNSGLRGKAADDNSIA